MQNSGSYPRGPDVSCLRTAGDVAPLPAVPCREPESGAPPCPTALSAEKGAGAPETRRGSAFPMPSPSQKLGERAGRETKKKAPCRDESSGAGRGAGVTSDVPAPRRLPRDRPHRTGSPGRRLRAPTLLPAQGCISADVLVEFFSVSHPPRQGPLSGLHGLQLRAHPPLPTRNPLGLQSVSASSPVLKQEPCKRRRGCVEVCLPFLIHSFLHSSQAGGQTPAF